MSRVSRAQPRVVQAHEPSRKVQPRTGAAGAQRREDILLLQQLVWGGTQRCLPVAARRGPEIYRPVVWEDHAATGTVRAQELAGVITGGHDRSIEAGVAEPPADR